MKPKASLRAFLLGTSLLAAQSTLADTITWDANGVTALQTDGAGVWLTANQWWNGSTNVDWTSYTAPDAVFGNGGAGGAVTLASPTTVGFLTFNYFTGTYTLGTAGQAITLNGGITRNATMGYTNVASPALASVVNIISPITLGAAQTWTNNSVNPDVKTANGTLVVGTATDGINLNGNHLTIDGVGVTAFKGIISGAGGLTKNGSGTLILGANPAPVHTFSGGTIINGGVVRFSGDTAGTSGSFGAGGITINSGVIESYFGTNITRSLGTGSNQIQILGGVSGFSEQGSNSTVTLNNNAAFEVVWGAANEASNVLSTGFFNPSALVLQWDTVNAGKTITFANKLDLNGTSRSIYVGQGSTTAATISNVIRTSSGTAGLTKEGIGNLILTAANTYNGETSITDGLLTLSGTAGAIASSSAINLSGGGTLRLVNVSTQATLNRVGNSAAITSNGGTISYENTSTNAISYAENLGSVGLVSGQLNIVETVTQAGTGASNQTLTLSGLTRTGASNTSAITFSAASTGPQASGNRNMIVVTGSGTTATNEIIGSWATTGTAAATQTDYAVYSGNYVVPANIAASNQSTWSTSTSATSNYTMSNAAGAATTLSATRNINSLRNTSVVQNVTFDAATDVVSLAGHTFNNGDVFTFGGTAPTGATNGNVYYVRDVVAGVSFKVAAISGGAALDFTGAGTPNVTGGITLSSGNNLGTTGILQAMASGLAIGGSGTGVLTLPTTTADNLHLTVGNTAAMTVGVPIADNTASGVLTLVKNGSGTLRLDGNHTYTGNTVINAGTLQLGNNSAATLGGGSYAGDIFIARGAALTLQGNSTNALSGTISGDGNLNLIRGSTTLSNTNTYTGKTTVGLVGPTTSGSNTVTVSKFNSVFTDVGLGTVHSASSSFGAPTTVANGTIDFGGGVQTTAQINYTGTGETTDRVINFIFNGSSSRVIDSSASGVLKFASAAVSNGTSSSVILQGTGNGEFVHGLGFSFANLTKSGAGTWTLGGAVGSTGTLTVSASGGTLALQQKSSLMGGNTANWTAAKVIVNTGGTLALNVGGTDQFNITDVTTVLTNLGGLGGAINNNGLRSGSTIGFDTTNAAGGTFTIADEIKNATGTGSGAIGLNKLGTGTLALTGATHTYTGATTVSAGKLVINGNISTSSLTTVAVGAILGGSGTVGKAIINGTLAVGNSPGQMDFTDTLGLNGTTIMEIDGTAGAGVAGGHDFVNLTGAGAAGVLSYGGILMLDMGVIFGAGSYTWNLFDFATETGTFTTVSLADQYSGSLLDGDLDGIWNLTSGDNTWQFTESTGVLGLTVIPEPRAALLGGLGLLMLLRRRR